MALKTLSFIKKALRITSCITICFLTIIVAMQVINRNLFGHSFTWVEELAAILMVYVTYFGAAIATINNSNTRIDFFIRQMPYKAHQFFEILDDFICVIFLTIIALYSTQGIRKNISMFTPAMHLPIAVSYLGIMLGSILMILFYLVRIWIDLKKNSKTGVSSIEEVINQDE